MTPTRTPSTLCRLVATAGAMVALAIGPPNRLGAQEGTDPTARAVSPGSTAAAERLAGSCPAFSWSHVDDASGYELVLYRVNEAGDLETALQKQMPAGASSWTPSAAQCPASESQFAWAVRALTADGAGAWSEALLFATPGAPSEDELRQALDTLRRYREDREGDVGEGLAPSRAPDADASGRDARRYPTGEPASPSTTKNQQPATTLGADLEALSLPTLSATPSPQTVTTPASFSLNLDGDLDLGGFVFKDGTPFIHTDGSATYGNTAVGLNALVSATPGSPSAFSGVFNSAFGLEALHNNTTGQVNTASGVRALYSNTTGGGNTASGFQALFSNTTGFDNTASGSYALFRNTTGYVNTAIGDGALFDNTTGHRNTAVGRWALRNNTTGFRNTASGNFALFDNTTGLYNTASGNEALRSNTTGIRNSASGHQALSANTTGSRNTAIGQAALRSNTEGSYNTASGGAALASNTTGLRNTASGHGALFANTTGSLNTASGYHALASNTTGSYNTAIGRGSGADWTTGDGNIALGRGAVGAAGESGVIRIGGDNKQTQTFIEGISGTTVAGLEVRITAGDQLGVAASSARFKQDIHDLEGVSDQLLDLRPVSFRYKDALAKGGPNPIEYGLIAEEVAEIFPELVVYDEEGRPFTVRYHLLTPLLLGEIQSLYQQMAERDRIVADLHRRLEQLAEKRRFR